jgi:hypothetical protein
MSRDLSRAAIELGHQLFGLNIVTGCEGINFNRAQKGTRPDSTYSIPLLFFHSFLAGTLSGKPQCSTIFSSSTRYRSM